MGVGDDVEVGCALRIAAIRPHELFPTAIEARIDHVDLIEHVRAILSHPKLFRDGIKGQPE